ncbi:MAG: glycosyltransferase family 4 protein [Anaerolineaceae bacterium]|nr:glycosyltransferase family 4 protein [Anaerolineaceae bacterium]
MTKPQTTTSNFSPMLLLGTQMEIGGAQKILLEQAAWFHHKGLKVFVVFIYDKVGLEKEWQEKYPFPVINLRSWKSSGFIGINILRLFLAAIKILRLIFKENIKMVETFTNDSNLIGMPLAWLAGVPIRIANHQGPIARRPLWMANLQALMVNWRIASHLVVVSQDLQEHVINIDGVKHNRTKIIHNGYSLNLTSELSRAKFSKELGFGPEKTFYALTVGRLAPQKAHETLIDAIPRVIAVHPEIIFLFAGDGEKRQALKKQAEELGVTTHLRFLGVRRDIHNIMKICDVMVMSSLWEGFSLAMLEGMAMGLPVIGTEVVGIKEMLGENIRGLVVPPQNPEALANAIIQMMENDIARDQFGKSGQEYVQERYSMDVMCQKYEEFFSYIENK